MGSSTPSTPTSFRFRMAGIQSFRSAVPSLNPVLLEPVMHLTIRVPEDHTGDVMGDINSKRGKVMGIDSDGSSRVIEAEIPMSEVQRYAADLRSMTSGRGTFEIRFDHYAEVPHQEAQKGDRRLPAATATERTS